MSRKLLLPPCAKCSKKLPIDQAREEWLRQHQWQDGQAKPDQRFFHRHCRPKEQAA